MINDQLISYVASERARGVSDETIRTALLAQGWQEADVTEVLGTLSAAKAPLPTSTSLPGVFETMKESWSLYTKGLATLLGISVLPMLLFVTGIAAMLLYIFFAGVAATTLGLGLVFTLLLSAALLVVFVIFQTWSQIAIIYAIKDRAENIGVVEAYRRGWSKIFSYWWVMIIAAFINFGGFILFVVPGVIFMVWLTFSSFVLVAEGLTGMKALEKSREYVRGHWWAVFLRLIFILALSMLVSWIFSFILDFAQITYLTQSGGFIARIFFYPFTTVYLFLVYSSLKTIKGEFVFTPDGGTRKALIAVAIIGGLVAPVGIFSSVALASLSVAREKSRDAYRIAQIHQTQLGLELYYYAHQTYPENLSALYAEGLMKESTPTAIIQGAIVYHLEGTGSTATYRIGTSLEREDNAVLLDDGDILDEYINGDDRSGCLGEPDLNCYDIKVEFLK